MTSRHAGGITQDQLAALSGIDSSNIRAYENGRSIPSVQSLVRIAAALNVPPGDLLDELTPEVFASERHRGRRAG